MTQKDLAERLNVSDKSVSRWERDYGTPDLSIIPVIAEIFDVTCDELLRGERELTLERIDSPCGNQTSAKAKKQLQRIIKSALNKCKNHAYLSVGISINGLIVALICNFVFFAHFLAFSLD